MSLHVYYRRPVLVDELKERYIVDNNGTRVAVILEIEDYHKLLEELEELESIRAYDAAKALEDEAVPFRGLAENAGYGH